ncbi:MAG: pyridoxal phosphate-dependent aminotransferase, partial [Dehalococcoidia bacterium]
GGFYLYPDFSSAVALDDAEVLARRLLDRHGVGVLAGPAFGDDPRRLTFRAATSLLYGEDKAQRWAALRSEDPLALPWIAAALDRLRDALAELPRQAQRQG